MNLKELKEQYIKLGEEIVALENKPEYIDLPDNIELTNTINQFSIGIITPEGCDLFVDLNNGKKGLVSGALELTSLNKKDYALIKSTKEDCMQVGQVFAAFSCDTVENSKRDIANWKIAQDCRQYCFTDSRGSIYTYDTFWNNYYKLVKREK